MKTPNEISQASAGEYLSLAPANTMEGRVRHHGSLRGAGARPTAAHRHFLASRRGSTMKGK